MDRQSLIRASATAFLVLVVWWAGIGYLDDFVASSLPYNQYATVSLFYPEVFYPGIPGLLLAETLFVVGLSAIFGGLTYEVGLFGWMVILPIGLGVGSTWFGERHDRSPTKVVVIALGGLFVFFTVVEAVGSLLA